MTWYLVSVGKKITGGAGQFKLSAFMLPVSLKIFEKHVRSVAQLKRTGEGLANAIPLMVWEPRVVEYFRAVLAIKLDFS